ELVVPDLTLSDVSAELALDNGNLSVKPWGFVMSGSRFEGAVALAARNAPAKLSFAVKAPKIDMGALLKDQADIELLRGDAAIDVDVSGTGNSVAAIMATLNGYSRFLMEKGEAKTESFDLIVGGLSSVMGTLFKSKTEWTVLNCLANDFQITDGIAKNQVMIMDTELLTITGEGQVNLCDETLALKVTPA
ncbi:MAG: AsmA-like C-terminal region-containing protein, partial [Alphaproteobacteria bacterium]